MGLQVNATAHLSARGLRLVAGGRLLMALFLCASVPLDLTGLAIGGPTAMVLFVYAAYAGLLLAATWIRSARHRLQRSAVVLAGIDATVFAFLIYTSGGADSPLFSPLVFLILSATLHWGSRGAMVMGVLASLIFWPTGLFAFGSGAGPLAGVQLVVRGGYLAVVALLLWAFARHFERVVDELGRLSDPVDDAAHDAEPPLTAALNYALRLFGSPRGGIIWADPEEPRVVLLAGETGEKPARIPVRLAPEDVPAAWYAHQAYLCAADGTTLVRSGGRMRPGPSLSIPAVVGDTLAFAQALVIHAEAAGSHAWLILCDHDELANEDLALAASAAAQVSLSLQRWRALEERRDIVAGEERLRVARDLHDGVLQFMAGAGLQLDALLARGELAAADRAKLMALRQSLGDEQRELRGLITHLRPGTLGQAGLLPIADELDELCERLGRGWDIDVAAGVSPENLVLPPAFCFDLTRLVREAVANAVRHGQAKTVQVAVAAEDEHLTLIIQDDGRGLPQPGRWDDRDMADGLIGPKSLRERTLMLGGRLTMESSPAGLTLTAALPMPEAA